MDVSLTVIGKWLLKLVEPAINIIQKIFKKNDLNIPYPRKTMIILEKHPHFNWWHMGTTNKKPAMQIACRFKVTNIAKDLAILPSRAVLKRSKTFGVVSIEDRESGFWGSYLIPCNSIGEISIDFWVEKPFCKESEDFKSDIVIFDQFNNKHIIKNVIFFYK